jgi:hypothetical protein
MIRSKLMKIVKAAWNSGSDILQIRCFVRKKLEINLCFKKNTIADYILDIYPPEERSFWEIDATNRVINFVVSNKNMIEDIFNRKLNGTHNGHSRLENIEITPSDF